MNGLLASLWELVKIFTPGLAVAFILSVWILAFAELRKRLRERDEGASRSGIYIRFLLTPLAVTVFLLSIPLAPVLAVVGLVLAAVLLLFFYPISLLVRSFPEILKNAIEQAKILSRRIFELDEELLSSFVRRLRAILRVILGNLGMLLVRFPPLINWSMRWLSKRPSVRQKFLADIRRFERRMQIGIAADLLLAIAIDPNHLKDTRAEAVRLLRELNRPVEDLLHIITVPGMDAGIAIEAANQAVTALNPDSIEGQAGILKVWQALAAHDQVEARLYAAEKLSGLGEVEQARTLLRALIASGQVAPVFRAQAAGKLSETSLDSGDERAETPAEILSEAEQALRMMANRRNAWERLEGSAGMARLGHVEFIPPIVNLLDDASVEPELRQRALAVLVELKQWDQLRFAVEKSAPAPELLLEHRWDAILALQKALPAEAVKHWAAYAHQPELPFEQAKKALANLREAFASTAEGAASPQVQQGFSTLLELGSNESTPAILRLEAADTLEAMDQIKEANAIYYVLQNDPKVDRRLRRKATQAVSRLSRALLTNRSASQN